MPPRARSQADRGSDPERGPRAADDGDGHAQIARGSTGRNEPELEVRGQREPGRELDADPGGRGGSEPGTQLAVAGERVGGQRLPVHADDAEARAEPELAVDPAAGAVHDAR